MKIKYIMIILTLCLALIMPNVWGQASSANFKLYTGSTVGGGGSSFSDGYIMKGTVVTNPSGGSESVNYFLEGGASVLSGSAHPMPMAMPNPTPAMHYRIIGIPVNIPGSRNPESVFGGMLGAYNNTQWRLGRYSSPQGITEEYPNVPDVYPGLGYWLITKSARGIELPGTNVMLNFQFGGNLYYRSTYVLDTGWNQLSNPMPFAIGWNQILFEDAGVVQMGHPATVLDDMIHIYGDAGFYDDIVIPPWGGFFVHINKPGIKVLFPNREFVPPMPGPNKTEPSINNWAIDLKLESNGFIDGNNKVGVKSDASNDFDRYDHFEPPPPPGGASLAFKTGEVDRICTDFRKPFNDGALWIIEINNCNDGRLSISGLDQIPIDMSAWLKLGGNLIQLSEGTSIPVSGETQSGQLIIGTAEYLAGEVPELLPLDFRLDQNFPNPFNPVTIINYSLPEPGNVRLEIYNILGQKVKTLVDDEMPTGRYTVAWNSTDDNNYTVSSGIYFYRIEYNDLVKQRKMVMLK